MESEVRPAVLFPLNMPLFFAFSPPAPRVAGALVLGPLLDTEEVLPPAVGLLRLVRLLLTELLPLLPLPIPLPDSAPLLLLLLNPTERLPLPRRISLLLVEEAPLTEEEVTVVRPT